MWHFEAWPWPNSEELQLVSTPPAGCIHSSTVIVQEFVSKGKWGNFLYLMWIFPYICPNLCTLLAGSNSPLPVKGWLPHSLTLHLLYSVQHIRVKAANTVSKTVLQHCHELHVRNLIVMDQKLISTLIFLQFFILLGGGVLNHNYNFISYTTFKTEKHPYRYQVKVSELQWQ